MFRRPTLGSIFVCLAAMAGWGSPILFAQDYKSAFSAVQVDRAKTPATWHKGLSVDAPTGALSVDLPLGPGIGTNGLHFTPTLRSRWAPHWEGFLNPVARTSSGTSTCTGCLGYDYYPMIRSLRAGEFNPLFGGLQLKTGEEWSLPPGSGDSATYVPPYSVPSHPDTNIASFQLPDGTQGSLGGGATTLSVDQANMLIQKFGYTSDWRISDAANVYTVSDMGSKAWNPSAPPSAPFIQVGGDGSLILGLWAPNLAEGNYYSLMTWAYVPTSATVLFGFYGTTAYPSGTGAVDPTSGALVFPPKILVIKGDLATEFTYGGGYWSHGAPADPSQPTSLTNRAQTTPLGANYLPTRMMNKFGDAIAFTATTATWLPAGGGTGPSISLSAANGVTTLTYSGANENPSFRITDSTVSLLPDEATLPTTPILAKRWMVGSVEDTTTQETVTFTYTSQPDPALPSVTTLSSVAFPGRTVSAAWSSYAFFDNDNGTSRHWNSVNATHQPDSNTWLPNYTAGVKTLTETDTATSTSRVEQHTRVVPQPNWNNLATGWASTDFYDGITHPDGSVTVYRFVPPNALTVGPTTQAGLMQFQAYNKHLVWEEREYPIGSGYAYSTEDPTAVQWVQDMNAHPASGPQPLATRITEFDRWDVRSIANPGGVLPSYGWQGAGLSAVPHPTRTRSWDVVNQTLTSEEHSDWDATNLGYTTATKWTSTAQTGLGSYDILNLLDQGAASADPSSLVWKEVTSHKLESVGSEWIWDRSKGQQSIVQSDISAGLAKGQVLPYGAPPLAETFDDYDRVKNITHGESAGANTTVQFTYNPIGTVGSGQLATAQVTGNYLSSSSCLLTPAVNSGSVGVSAYGYDPMGFLSSIQPMGASYTVRQGQDGLGVIGSQTDANGLNTTFSWDDACRLTGILPPNGEVGTTVAMDSDNLGFQITHGKEVSWVRFNGFGERIVERRSTDGGSTWVHRSWSYDPMGRVLGETVWLSGSGSEAEWMKPNLAGTATVTTYTASYVWDYDGPKPVKIFAGTTVTTQTLAGMYAGKAWAFDGLGREVKYTDGNGTLTSTAYGVRTKTVTLGTPGGTVNGDSGVASVSTSFSNDELGRLILVKDALNQTTSYAYDAAGRVLQVIQTDPQTSLQQVRSWSYDGLGRVTKLVQPESGATLYDGFTVTGKPTVTTYGYGTPNPEVVHTIYDPLDRVKQVYSDDNTVNQSFTYGDEPAGAGHGLANAKLVKANTLQGASRELFYNGLNGRLSSLVRGIDQLTWSIGLGYDSEGRVNSRTYPDGKTQVVTFDPYKAMPIATNFGGSGLATLAYDPTSWALAGLTFGNNASSFFSYGSDQVRLRSMTHTLPSGTIASWNYQYDTLGWLSSDGEDYYAYDPLGRLKNAVVRDPFNPSPNQGISQGFTYDAFGNRQSLSSQTLTNWTAGTMPPATPAFSVTSKGQSYQFNATDPAFQKNQLPSATASGAATGALYDVFGNLTQIYALVGQSGTQLTLNYDALMRVTTLGDSNRATSETYTYDDDGLRMKVRDSSSGLVKYNIYDEGSRLITQYQQPAGGSCSWKKDIIYLGDKEIAEVDSAGTEVTFEDHLGSPRFSWRGGTSALIKQKYLPFGELLADPTSSALFAKGFTNHEQTDPSGLIYMQARFYAPMYGRFLSPDPARDQHFEQTQSWNIYSYVQNDPTMRVDPTGMIGLKDAVGAVGSYIWSALTTHNPIYQAVAQVQDIAVAGINNAAGSNLPMVSNLGKAADANPQMGTVTALAQGLKPAQDVMTIAVAGKVAGKVVEGASGALQGLRGKASGEAEKELSSQAQRGIRSLEKQIAKHEEKLADFKANPTTRPGMEGQPKSVIEAQRQSRIDHLQKEIRTFKANIDKIKKGN